MDSVTLYQDSNWIIMRNGRMILIKFSGKIGSAVGMLLNVRQSSRPGIVPLLTCRLSALYQMGKRREASRPELMELSEWRTWETLAAIQDCVGTLCFPIP